MQVWIRNPLPWQEALKQGSVPLIVVRHGQTDRNREGRFSGRDDVSLDAQGEQQAVRLAEALGDLPLCGLWSSPLRRAQQTLAPLAARCGLPVRLDARLAELDQGELDGLPGHLLPERYPDFFAAWRADPTHVAVPGGETFGACQARMLAALREIAHAQAHAEGPVVVASHKMAIVGMLCAVLGLPLRRYRWLGQDNAAINLLWLAGGSDEKEESRLLLRRLNERSHLG